MSNKENDPSCIRSKIIERASLVGIAGNAALAAAKLIAGFLGHSYALLGDGIDSLTDVVTSTVTFYTARIVDKPPDEKHPYGHGRAETIATKALSFVIFFAGAQLLFSSLQHLIGDEQRQLPRTFVLLVALVSVAGKIILALVKFRAGKRAESSMLIADAKNMSMDVGISLSVLIGLFFTIRLGLPIVDTFIALAVSLWIMWVGLNIFLETSVELMDGLQDRSIYKAVCKAALDVEGVHNPHKMRIRKVNTKYVIDMDVEVDGDLCVKDGHEKAKDVQRRVHEALPEVYDVQIHVEPYGNEETRERYGVSHGQLAKKRQDMEIQKKTDGLNDEDEAGEPPSS